MIAWVAITEAVSSVVLAIFTAVLAVVTYLYYRQSRDQTKEVSNQSKEMRRTRQLRYEPKLKAGVRGGRPNFEIGFVNIGGGIAQEVEATYWIEGLEEHKQTFSIAVHFPEDVFRIGFPVNDSGTGEIGTSDELKSYVNGKNDKLIVEWNYKDARNKPIDHQDEFSIFDQIEGRTESTEFYSDAEEYPRF